MILPVAHLCHFAVSGNVSLLEYMQQIHIFAMCHDLTYVVIHVDFYVRPMFELYNPHVEIAAEFLYGTTSPRHLLPLSFYEFFHWHENGGMLFQSGDSLAWVRG